MSAVVVAAGWKDAKLLPPLLFNNAFAQLPYAGTIKEAHTCTAYRSDTKTHMIQYTVHGKVRPKEFVFGAYRILIYVCVVVLL